MTRQCQVWPSHPDVLFSLGLTPLWRPSVERRVYWRSREKSEKSPRTLSFREGRRTPSRLPTATVVTSAPPSRGPQIVQKAQGPAFLTHIIFHLLHIIQSILFPTPRYRTATTTTESNLDGPSYHNSNDSETTALSCEFGQTPACFSQSHLELEAQTY